MGLIWYAIIFSAIGAVCSIAMILVSDRLQHRETRVTSIRTQDFLQYQLDNLTAQHNSPAAKQAHAKGAVEQFPSGDEVRVAKPEPVGSRPEARFL